MKFKETTENLPMNSITYKNGLIPVNKLGWKPLAVHNCTCDLVKHAAAHHYLKNLLEELS
jgi:hypothetical protein